MYHAGTWKWLAFALTVCGYIPMIVGAVSHPSELNVASFALWLILSLMFLGSSMNLGFDGWRLPLGFFVGNATMLAVAAVLPGTTFNLGTYEKLVLFGIVIVGAIWYVHGTYARAYSPRILLWGAVAIDVLSCYPQMKQYLYDAHEPMTSLGLMGWSLWIMGVLVNLVFVDEMPRKLRMKYAVYGLIYRKEKRIPEILEASIFSIEQTVLMPILLWSMW